jgi:hypothetical protein
MGSASARLTALIVVSAFISASAGGTASDSAASRSGGARSPHAALRTLLQQPAPQAPAPPDAQPSANATPPAADPPAAAPKPLPGALIPSDGAAQPQEPVDLTLRPTGVALTLEEVRLRGCLAM